MNAHMNNQITHTIESMNTTEKTTLAVCIVAWEIAENVHRIMKNGNEEALQTPFEQRWKNVLAKYQDDPLFVWLQENCIKKTKEKYIFLQQVQWRLIDAMMYIQQGKSVEDLYMETTSW